MYSRDLKPLDLGKMLDTWVKYFGEPLEKTLQDILTTWLTEEAGQSAEPMVFFAALNRVVLSSHPRQYRRLPGIAELEGYKAAAWALYNDTAPGQNLNRLALEDKSEYVTPEQLAELNAKLFRRAI